ncbi:MAG: DUF2125 domain-containing protein [Caulobacteraceae bacterium]|nr:DUF2125 domain-containing protein [Caulobacteraceae bacterium]
MTSEPVLEPKGRSGLGGVFIVVALLALVVGGWTWWWFQVAHRVEQQVDRSAAVLRQAGYTVSWKKRSVSGWPFRAFLKFDDARVAAPSGHILFARVLQAEANAYDVTHWVASAPKGVIFTRAGKGAVTITGQALRASFTHPDRAPPTLVVELTRPVFAAAEGAEPFPLASAELIALNIRQREGAPGTGLFLFRVEGGKPRPDGMLEWIGGGELFSTRWEGAITHIEAFRGAGWTGAARNWSRAGGALTELQGRAETGSASTQADAVSLTAGPDGRLRGRLNLSIIGAPQSLLAMARAHAVDPQAAAAAATVTGVAGGLNGTARARLDFTGQGAMLGPVRLSDAPRVY